MSDHRGHDAHMARLQRVLDRLGEGTKQARDLSRMAAELRQEANESIQLLKASAPMLRKPKQAQKRKRR